MFFINVSLEPVIGPCRDSFDISVCKVAVWVLLWLMDLPVIVTLFLAFSILLSVVIECFPKIKVFIWYLLFGYVSSYLVIGVVTYPGEFNLVSWYMLAAIVTHSITIAGSIWAASHLTWRATRRLRLWFA